MTIKGIHRAVEAAGSQVKLAELLGCTQQLISVWVIRGHAPIGRIIDIENATGIDRKDLINPKLLNLLTHFVE